MRSEPEDRLSETPAKKGPSGRLLLGAVAIAAIIGIALFTGGDRQPPPAQETVAEPAVVAAPAAPVPAEMPPAPDIPARVEPAVDQSPPAESPAAPVVTLEASDEELRARLSAASSSSLLSGALQKDDLVQRSAGAIDGLSQGLIPHKALPIAPPEGKFSTVAADGLTYTDPGSYARYDSYARAIAALDVDLMVSTFHRYRPLMEQAYASLGYPAQDMDNALIRSLDYILATPELTAPAALQRKEAVYQYVDPQLEQLTPIQKQVLRMGPDNAAVIKQQAAVLRARLLEEAP